MSNAPLDLTVLASMFGDDEVLRMDILREFKASALPYMEELNQALAASHADGVKSLAHKLKSSSRTVGASPLADICEALEETAPTQNWSRIGELEVQLRDALQDVIDCIDRL